MAGLVLTSEQSVEVTVISNNFIDDYMCNANGEFVKIYLYLLRCHQHMPEDFSLQLIADKMNLMENDVLRALHYWKQQGFLKMNMNGQNVIQSLVLTSPDNHKTAGTAKTVPVTNAPIIEQSSVNIVSQTPSLPKANRKIAPEVLQELALIAEQYLKRTLTPDDLDKFAYFYETLNFSEDLIEYLLEHCASMGKRTLRYIESVAVSWADQHITTVEQAKSRGTHFKEEYYQIIKAFGIRGRNPVDMEVDYMKKWLEEYHFSVDIICEACQRTIKNTGNTSFPYADSILKNWKEHGILAKKDIAALDNLHHAQQQAKQTAATRDRATAKPPAATKFSNFDQRSDYDFNQLEKQLNS